MLLKEACKRVVQRTKLLTSIVVYTGEESQKIYCTVLKPLSSLNEEEAQEALTNATQMLSEDGARPKEVCTIAHFIASDLLTSLLRRRIRA
jgi:hypothetical protein